MAKLLDTACLVCLVLLLLLPAHRGVPAHAVRSRYGATLQLPNICGAAHVSRLSSADQCTARAGCPLSFRWRIAHLWLLRVRRDLHTAQAVAYGTFLWLLLRHLHRDPSALSPRADEQL